jgi:hypothetical protein
MDLSKILSISGRSGLFKVISQGKNAMIVESLTDNKRFPAFGHEKISSLEEISVFTTGEDMPLKDVFRAIHDKLEGKSAVDPKSDNNALKSFFLEMIPDFDQERVYVSDIRKMVAWYNLLHEHNLLDFTEPEAEKTEEAAASTPTEETGENPAAAPEAETPPAKARKTAKSGENARKSKKSE